MGREKNEKDKKHCANCFVCMKDTIYCPISENYDPEKAFEKLMENMKIIWEAK